MCCDQSQYTALSSQTTQISALIGRCQACYASFIEFFCEFTCSPNQAMFVTVDGVSPAAGCQTLAVNSTTYTVADQYAQKFFDSCRDVKSSASGAPILSSMFGANTYSQKQGRMQSSGGQQGDRWTARSDSACSSRLAFALLLLLRGLASFSGHTRPIAGAVAHRHRL